MLAADGPFAQFLAIVRAEQSDAERFQQILAALAERLEPVAGQDKMRWRDLLHLIVSWVLQRRPAEEREGLIRVLQEAQRDLALREEVLSVSETTKQSWAQIYQAEAQARAEARVATQAEARGAMRSLRDTLIKAFRRKFGEPPEPLLTSIRACDEEDRLQEAIFQLQMLTSPDQFKF